MGEKCKKSPNFFFTGGMEFSRAFLDTFLELYTIFFCSSVMFVCVPNISADSSIVGLETQEVITDLCDLARFDKYVQNQNKLYRSGKNTKHTVDCKIGNNSKLRKKRKS